MMFYDERFVPLFLIRYAHKNAGGYKIWSQVLRKYIRTLIIFWARYPASSALEGDPDFGLQISHRATNSKGRKHFRVCGLLLGAR